MGENIAPISWNTPVYYYNTSPYRRCNRSEKPITDFSNFYDYWYDELDSEISNIKTEERAKKYRSQQWYLNGTDWIELRA